MNDYPLKVYLSASWRGDNAVIDKLVATHLMRQGVTVLQDHPDNKTDPPIKPWLRRVDLYMRDCGGLVAVLPFRQKDPQTTSPYMFPEILSAARRGLSILIFHHQGVRISRSDTAGAAEISFGVEDRELLNADQLFGDQVRNDDQIDELLTSASRLVLPENAIFDIQPIPAPQEKLTERVIEDFVTHLEERGESEGPYVMNILPFIDHDSAHLTIARAVFRSTGLKCKVSLDAQGKNREQRSEWKRVLEGAEFYVAELSRLRDNCIYEVGLGQGAGKSVIVVCRRKLDTLPFGLDNERLLRPYKHRNDLGKEVERGCELLYRRKVHNLDPELRREFLQGTPGIPPWLDVSSDQNLNWKLTASVFAISVAIALLLLSSFHVFSSLKWDILLLSLASISLGIFGNLRSSREWIERKLRNKLHLIPRVALGLLLLAMIIFIWGAFWHAETTQQPHSPDPVGPAVSRHP